MNVQFYELALGAVFRFKGTRYQKIAMGMARDEKRRANVFLAATEVEPEGTPRLLEPDELERQKPSERHWTEHLGLAPGQAERLAAQDSSR